MTQIDPNAPAFPSMPLPAGHYGTSAPGMSIRAWLAGMAMHALVSNPDKSFDPTDAADYAVLHADALIAALNNPSH